MLWLRPKIHGYIGYKRTGFVTPGSVKQWAMYYMVKQHLETVMYKPVCHDGFKISCVRTYPHAYDMLRNARVSGGV